MDSMSKVRGQSARLVKGSRLYARLRGTRKICIRRRRLRSRLGSEVSRGRRRVGQLATAHQWEQLLSGEGELAANRSRGLTRTQRRRKTVKRKSSKNAELGSLEPAAVAMDSLATKENEDEIPGMESGNETPGMENGNETPGMEEWYQLQTPPAVVRALSELGFRTPTEIQRRAIPPAIGERCNVIGAAETGSGKTLAFAIPILHYILHNCKHETTPTVTTPLIRKGRQKVWTPGKGKIVDLNQVIYLTEEGAELETEEQSEEHDITAGSHDLYSDVITGSHDSTDDITSVVEYEGSKGDSSLAEDLSDSDASSPSEPHGGSMDSGRKVSGLGLVTYRDNIPDDEFEMMLRGRSHDHPVDPGNELHPAPVTVSVRSLPGYCGRLAALVLAPTRELALQVHSHIRAAAKYTGIKVCAVVGGMAIEKQERLLRQLPPIVVATPGRLWKLMSEGDSHLCSLDHLRFLVLDEADRMVEYGHYQELGRIIDRVNGVKSAVSRQTLVFSATLALPRRSTERRKRKRGMSREESLDNLMARIGLSEGVGGGEVGGAGVRGGGVRVVDLTRARGTVGSLTETKITCTNEEKDTYLYYFLLLYPGRTLVFANSIDCLQRVRSLLLLLRLQPLPLHAHMQQKQRIKNLERFASNPTGLLLASDVAARGLDIPSVQHVIHYQVPRNSELYVHRSGRTARALAEGLSVIFVGPDDVRAYRNICRTLNRDEELPTFPVDPSYLKPIRVRVRLAKRIDSREHKQRKSKKSNDWLTQSAKAMDIVLDEDMFVKGSGGSERVQVQSMKAELDCLLGTPILPRSVSMTFPTRDGNHGILARISGASVAAGRTQRVVTVEDRAALDVARQKVARKK